MGRELEALPAADAFWLDAETPDNLMVINGVLGLDGVVELETLRRTIEPGLLGFTRFRRPIVRREGRAYWGPEAAAFDARAHFEEITLSEGATEADIQAVVSELVSRPLPEGRPLWQTYLLQGHPRGSVVVSRVHHCIADGIALVHVLLSMASPASPPPAPNTPAPPVPVGPLDRVRRAVAGAQERVHQGWRFMEHFSPREVVRRGQDFTSAASKLATMSSQTHPVFKGRLGVDKVVAWTEPMPLAPIKALGQRRSAKINDVLVAMAAGAIRRYLEARGAPVDGEILRATVPVNLRPMSQAHQLGNRFGLVFLHLPVSKADPEARLAAVKAEMDAIKGGAEAVVSFGLLRALGFASGAIEEQAVDLFSRKSSLVLTNVPGPRAPLLFAGRPLRRIMFWVPQTGSVSMGLSIISYVDHVMVGVQVDRGLMPEPGALTRAMEDELSHMLEVL